MHFLLGYFMNKINILCLLFVLALQACATTPAQPELPKVETPKVEKDRYEELVALAETTDDPVNFLELREAFLKNSAFISQSLAGEDVMNLRKEMFAAMQGTEATKVRAKAQAILKLDFLNLYAQQSRYQACIRLKEEPCATRGKRTYEGLVKSILSSGDGKSCATAWKVVTVDEEYFIMSMNDLKVSAQAVIHEAGKTCDQLSARDKDGKPQSVFFNIGEMLNALTHSLSL